MAEVIYSEERLIISESKLRKLFALKVHLISKQRNDFFVYENFTLARSLQAFINEWILRHGWMRADRKSVVS